ncbi:conserved exported hypothetical protein [Paraburkholderia piptadeniae]|uniref:Tricarboxylate transport protein TctC n=1 Tax=Paraburkholderia piptadeniae TaxID=1701573 RepID=A0A1N7SE82_9BURK|nr:tripartite tricarboxylate transporter substrate binding protein [Paraburkholderia piptadeniae]SIT45642.1 conserved exported hypothetical protein [Paraburkholderia piptadeniae]
MSKFDSQYPMPGRRKFIRVLCSGAAGAAAAWALPAWSQDVYPSNALNLIVPWSAGGGSDAAMRAFAQVANKYLKQAVIVINMPGAGGTIGPAHMAHSAKPDGYTIGQIPGGVFRQPAMRKTAWDPLKDFSYISRIGGYEVAIAVRADSPFKTLGDVIAFAKDNPGKVSYGSTGVGTSNHLGIAAVGLKAGVQLTHVPFKGSAESLTALMGGHITLVSSESAGSFIDSGKMRALATAGEKRLGRWPNVPTLIELGYNVVSDSPYGLAGPAGMDPKIVAYLDNVVKQVTKDPEFLAAMDKLDQTVIYLNTADYKSSVVKEVADSKRLIEALGIAGKS